jgi:hypothetical protein
MTSRKDAGKSLIKFTNDEREVKQQVPKEVKSYSTRRICQRMSDIYSSTYMLHNLLRQDSFGPHELGIDKGPTHKQTSSYKEVNINPTMKPLI